MVSRKTSKKVFRALVGGLVIAPAVGAALGSVVAFVAFLFQSPVYSPVYGLGFAVFHGLPFGAVFGWVFGLLVCWPLRREPIGRALNYLGGGTLLFALPFTLVPELGPVLSWLSGLVGFWVGFAVLTWRGRTAEA